MQLSRNHNYMYLHYSYRNNEIPNMSTFGREMVLQRNRLVGGFLSCLFSIEFVSKEDIDYSLMSLYDICTGRYGGIKYGSSQKYILGELRLYSQGIIERMTGRQFNHDQASSILESLLSGSGGRLLSTLFIRDIAPIENEILINGCTQAICILGNLASDAYQRYNEITARMEHLDSISKLPHFLAFQEWEVYIEIFKMLQLLKREEESRRNLFRIQLMNETQIFRILKGLC
ncbi:hypothetical protein P167DRAFT_269516 [Morchella conica CCBAS932]|uniref:Uncharacterized protein n=1 Tax=Morchella conica CCBAS932 TaxID=1392247 RepID=A0A3N4KLG8_9PEZI|nr:hypothetical protein P167DRAFT_269516 [Morchella conica CCBAS932]